MSSIADVMTPRSKFVVLQPHESVHKAHDEMDSKDIHHILVYPGDGDMRWKLYTRSDRVRFNAEGLESARERIGDHAIPGVHSAEPNLNCREAYKRMAKNHVKCLLVLEGGNVIGLVTDTDLNDKCK